ncbi:MAG: hypothetical protein IT319_03200, partial [Anaerolineae bacterium]|nr:hypothetical protein [Anaerolineae bacterium]
MKRLFAVMVVFVLALGMVLPTSAQGDAPEGVFYGTWPYVLPPDHSLNSFSPSGPTVNLGNLFWSYVELPPAIYNWGTQEYVGLLAESWGFADDNSYYEINLKPG